MLIILVFLLPDYFDMEYTIKRMIPFFADGLLAGFPSPGADYMEQAIDLNDLLIKNPSSTFIGRVSGDSMKDAGIFTGSLAIIDKSLPVEHGAIIVAWMDDGFTLKQLREIKGKVYLFPFNSDFKPMLLDDTMGDLIWGRVTHIINKT
jgi:DNA polymerase V